MDSALIINFPMFFLEFLDWINGVSLNWYDCEVIGSLSSKYLYYRETHNYNLYSGNSIQGVIGSWSILSSEEAKQNGGLGYSFVSIFLYSNTLFDY